MNLFFWKPKLRTLADVREHLSIPLDVARKNARILVIDDNAEAFPVELLRTEGYNVQHWPKVQNLRNLENGQFEIIILDIYGICSEELSINDGLGVLEHLKAVNPAQIVIAYSGKKFDLKQEKFWRLADDFIGKPSDLLTCKAKIDSILKERFTADHYWNSLVTFLSGKGVDQKTLKTLEDSIAKAVLQEKVLTLADIGPILKSGKEVIGTVWVIAQIIVKLSQLHP